MDDYVKRKSAYDALCKICNERDACDHTGQEGCHRVFAQIPAADVRENVHGDWVYQDPLFVDTIMCSVCGYNLPSDEFKTNFCPDCGADMRKEAKQ